MAPYKRAHGNEGKYLFPASLECIYSQEIKSMQTVMTRLFLGSYLSAAKRYKANSNYRIVLGHAQSGFLVSKHYLWKALIQLPSNMLMQQLILIHILGSLSLCNPSRME